MSADVSLFIRGILLMGIEKGIIQEGRRECGCGYGLDDSCLGFRGLFMFLLIFNFIIIFFLALGKSIGP